jgi:hypothetical protein
MQEQHNKPKVFLSYSERDTKFIQRLADDLRKCQIEPWQFTYEVRHGRPWLDSIFRYGLPTCDAIVAYLTEFSLLSPVVSKEIDAGILQKLSDNDVAFLPYVNDAKVRFQLRPDIQALQTPVWNDDNYLNMLPIVVSEIWRSYLERTVSSATKDERLKRVEAELELERHKSQPDEVFSKSENKEFEFIWNSFNKIIPLEFEVSVYDIGTGRIEKKNAVVYSFTLHLATLVASLTNIFTLEYQRKLVQSSLVKDALELVGIDSQNPDQYVRTIEFPDLSEFTDELLMHGLIEKFTITSLIDGSEY